MFARIKSINLGDHFGEAAHVRHRIAGKHNRADRDHHILHAIGHDHRGESARDGVNHGHRHKEGQDVPLVPGRHHGHDLNEGPEDPAQHETVDNHAEIDAFEDSQGMADVPAVTVLLISSASVTTLARRHNLEKKNVVAMPAMASDHTYQAPMIPFLATSLVIARG